MGRPADDSDEEEREAGVAAADQQRMLSAEVALHETLLKVTTKNFDDKDACLLLEAHLLCPESVQIPCCLLSLLLFLKLSDQPRANQCDNGPVCASSHTSAGDMMPCLH